MKSLPLAAFPSMHSMHGDMDWDSRGMLTPARPSPYFFFRNVLNVEIWLRILPRSFLISSA